MSPRTPLLLAALAATLAGCTSATTSGTADTAPATAADLPGLGVEARHGAAAFTVEKVAVGQLQLANRRTGATRPTEETLVAFTVRARNASDDLILVLNWWGWGFGSKPFAALKDARGNEYRRYEVKGWGDCLAGPDRDKGNRLKPGESSIDVLAFEPPLPTAGDLFLTVAVPAHGDHPRGEVAFRIPAAAWKK